MEGKEHVFEVFEGADVGFGGDEEVSLAFTERGPLEDGFVDGLLFEVGAGLGGEGTDGGRRRSFVCCGIVGCGDGYERGIGS